MLHSQKSIMQILVMKNIISTIYVLASSLYLALMLDNAF